MLTDIRFLSQLMAEATPACPRTAVVSILSPGAEPAKLAHGFADVLRLQFDDVCEEVWAQSATPAPVVPDELPEGPLRVMNYLWIDLKQARQIVTFIHRFAQAPETFHLLVHCEGGISRSAAVALWAANMSGAPIEQENPDTSGANRRVLRLLRQVNGD